VFDGLGKKVLILIHENDLINVGELTAFLND